MLASAGVTSLYDSLYTSAIIPVLYTRKLVKCAVSLHSKLLSYLCLHKLPLFEHICL